MTTLLYVSFYVVAAAFGWLAFLLLAATLIHGRAWVWERTRDAWHQHARRLRRNGVLGRSVPPSPDQPVAFTPRGGWL